MSSRPTTPAELKPAAPTPSPKKSPRKPHGGLKLFPATPSLVNHPSDNHNLTTDFESAVAATTTTPSGGSPMPQDPNSNTPRLRNPSVQSLKAQFEGSPAGQSPLRRTPAIKRPSSMRNASNISFASTASMEELEKAKCTASAQEKEEHKATTIRQVVHEEEEEDAEVRAVPSSPSAVDGWAKAQNITKVIVQSPVQVQTTPFGTPVHQSVFGSPGGAGAAATPSPAKSVVSPVKKLLSPAPILPEIPAQSFDVHFSPLAASANKQPDNGGKIDPNTLDNFPLPPAASVPLPASPAPKTPAPKGKKRKNADKSGTPSAKKSARLATPKNPEAIDVIISRTPQQEGDDTFYVYECVMKEDGGIQKLKEAEVERCSPRVLKEWKKLQY